MARMGGFSMEEMKNFQKQLIKMQQSNVEAFLDACAKELAARLLSKVIKLTPVGKKPKIKGTKTVKIKGASGKTKTFLSAESARIKQYWDGYVGGTLRRGWTSKTHEEAKSGKGSPTVEQAKAYVNSLAIQRNGKMLVIEIVNPVEYASYVEFGHRQKIGRYVPALGKKLKQGWVQGKLMLTTSEQELQKIAPKVLERKIKKFLGECMQ